MIFISSVEFWNESLSGRIFPVLITRRKRDSDAQYQKYDLYCHQYD